MAEQLTIHGEIAKLKRSSLPPEQQWQLACDDNPDLAAAFADAARQLIDAGVPATANRVAEELRARFRTVGDEYQFNNTWRRPASEWLRRTHPELAVDMRPRRARGRKEYVRV